MFHSSMGMGSATHTEPGDQYVPGDDPQRAGRNHGKVPHSNHGRAEAEQLEVLRESVGKGSRKM